VTADLAKLAGMALLALLLLAWAMGSGCGEPTPAAPDGGPWSPACDTVDGDPDPQAWIQATLGCDVCIIAECPGPAGSPPSVYSFCSQCAADGDPLTWP